MPEIGPYELFLVDDHKVVRDAIRAILSGHAEYHICGEAGTGVEAISLCRRLKPNLVLMDVTLPDLDGFEATREILRRCPETSVLILSMHGDQDSVRRALQCGARAYVVKSSDSSELLEALCSVAAGESYFSGNAGAHLAHLIQDNQPGDSSEVQLDLLTAREAQVLRLIASGKANKEIAQLLKLQPDTVRTYRKKMMRKLGINNTAGLTRLAISAGLIRRRETDKIDQGFPIVEP